MSNPIADLVREVEELRRRMENIMRPSKVADIDHAKGLVKIKSSDWTSDWLPWTELSGGIKTRNMPTKGQEVIGFFPSGELASGFVMPGHFTDANKAPSAPNGESVMARGTTKETTTDNSKEIVVDTFTLKCGGVTWVFSGSGLTQTGGSISHDGKIIDKTHGHVTAPPGPPGPPV